MRASRHGLFFFDQGLMQHPFYKLVVYYAALVGVGLIVGTLGPVLGDLATQTGTTLQQVSLVLAMRPLGYLGGTFLSGWVLERRPGHPVLALAAVLAAALLALVPLAPSLSVLALLILGMGLAQGLVDVGSNSLITWVFHGRLGPYLSGLHFSFGVGAFAAPLLVAWVLQAQGRSAGVFWVLAGYLILLALLFWRVPSPPHVEVEAAVSTPAPPADKKLAGLFLLCFFLYGGTESGFGAWIYHYALAYDPSATARAALLASAFWGLLGLGRLLGIPVLARFTPRQFLSVLMPLAVIGFSVAVLWPGRVWSLWAGATGAGLAMACVFPTMQVFAGQSLSRGSRVSSRLTSFFFVGSASGSMTLPWLMGQVFEPLGPRAALSLPALGALGMLACYAGILRRSR